NAGLRLRRETKSRVDVKDVVVIGGGLIGCALGRELARRGAHTVIVERGELGAEASRAAAGMVAPQAETERPGPLLDLALESRRRYRDWIECIQAESGVDVEYRTDGILYVALDAADARVLAARAAWQRRLGLRVTPVSPRAARRLAPVLPPRIRLAVPFPDDHRVTNERLAVAPGIAARRAGVVVRARTSARAIQARAGHVSAVVTDHGRIATRVAVNAAGAWAADVGVPSGVRPPQ